MDTHGGYVMDANGDYVYTDEVSVTEAGDAADKKIWRNKLIRVAMDGSVAVFSGMHVSQRGPAFLDLQHISGTTVQGASAYSTALNFGYMVGSLIAGFLFDRISVKVIMVCIPLTIASTLIALTPFCTSFISMLLMHIFYVPMYAIPETTITANEMNLWEEKSQKEAAIQFLSFCYSFGGVLGPLYTRPFLAPIPENETVADSNTDFHISNLTTSSYVPHTVTSPQNEFMHIFTNENDTSISYDSEYDSDLFYAYLITAIIGIVIAIPFYVLCLKKCSQKVYEEKKDTKKNDKQRKLALKPYIVLNLISAVFFFLYTMVEDTFNMFLSMFVVSHLHWSKADAALLSSLYWAVSTVAKLMMVIVIRRFGMERILFVSCYSIIFSLTAFIIASHFHIHTLLWISTAWFSLSQCSIFGGCFSWTDSNILKMDGKSTSIAMISAALGAMTGPMVLGITMEKISFMVFPYIELIQSILLLCHFMFMLFFLKPFVWRKYGDPCGKYNINCEIKKEVDEEKKNMIGNGEASDLVVNTVRNGDFSNGDVKSSEV